jgi:hypothetical protein
VGVGVDDVEVDVAFEVDVDVEVVVVFACNVDDEVDDEVMWLEVVVEAVVAWSGLVEVSSFVWPGCSAEEVVVVPSRVALFV